MGSQSGIRGPDPRPSELRRMSAAERAYVGAMIAGEGCVQIVKRRRNVRNVRVANTELELISALLRATGVGRVYLQTSQYVQQNPHFIPCWLWVVQRTNDVRELVKQCSPYSVKLQSMKEID